MQELFGITRAMWAKFCDCHFMNELLGFSYALDMVVLQRYMCWNLGFQFTNSGGKHSLWDVGPGEGRQIIGYHCWERIDDCHLGMNSHWRASVIGPLQLLSPFQHDTCCFCTFFGHMMLCHVIAQNEALIRCAHLGFGFSV